MVLVHKNKYSITFENKHGLNLNDYVIINVENTTDTFINGLHIIDFIINDYTVVLKTPYNMSIQMVQSGSSKTLNRDLFFSFLPVDISRVSLDKTLDIPIEIFIKNYQFNNAKFSLVNLDMKNYRYRLVDNVTNKDIHDNYHWILEAEVSNATIGKDENGLVWYDGNWKCGRWFGGTWMSGKWISGDFYSGIWNSRSTVYRLSHVEVSHMEHTNYSLWYNGRWFGGTWNGGMWYNGRWYDGEFNDGFFTNGIWNGGTWNGGTFSGGIWVYGTWYSGKFNMDTNNSYWIDGTWYGGDFENGRWLYGIFNKLPNKDSRFGTKSTSSKQSIWDAGIFNGGEVHSYLTTINGKVTSSDIYRNAIFKTCIWNNGDFYGGVIYNIDYKAGNFYGGIVDDIQIRALHVRSAIYDDSYDAVEIKLDLNGVFHFKDNNTITLLNNRYSYTQQGENDYNLDILGTYDNIKSYRILESEVINNEYTSIIIRTDLQLSQFSTIESSTTIEDGFIKSFYDMRAFEVGEKTITTTLVSNFKNTTIYNCTWYNGIFQEGNFIGGIWYDGYFNGNWGCNKR